MSNTAYTVGWVLWIVAFFCLEIPALASKAPGKTLSEHTWDWFRVRDSRHTVVTWVLRGILLTLLFWLFFHLGFAWLTPTHPFPWSH